MSLMDDEQREQYEMFKRVINLFNANPDLLRQQPALIPPLAELVASVAEIDALEATAPALEKRIREADLEVLARAEAIRDLVAPYRAQFVAAGLDPDFLEDLEDYIDELRETGDFTDV